ncbi:hypothetical protein ACQRCL_07645 [Limosilactobacillus reuteri]|uniref:hypothetical protein n=1 Tax=Limosilactobacillus reuteri TaxID=1598 RepID=UPI003D0266A8
MTNTNSKFYTNKDMAGICGVSEASMTNLVKSLELAPIKTGKYGRKYYDNKALEKVKEHYKNKAKTSSNSNKSTTKDYIIKQQQDHINDLKEQIKTLNNQLAVKDKQIEAQTEQVKQTSILLSQAHTLTLQAQKSKDDDLPKKTQETPQKPIDNSHSWIWKMFH